jgi:hypothetical protein
VEGLHCFFEGRIGVEAMDLKEIDICSVKTLEGGIDCIKDCLTG